MEATIRCKHCGGEFAYATNSGFMKRLYSEYGWLHIEIENSIRCPHCMKRLNNTAEELEAQLRAIVAELGVDSPAGMGKVMGTATKRLAGLADGRAISEMVKKILA